MSVRWLPKTATRRYQRRGKPRGYFRTELLQPEIVPFVLRRRGPRRPSIDLLQQQIEEYKQEHGIEGSIPEMLVHRELTRRGLHDGTDFDFQSSQAGGRLDLGGAVVDFLFEPRRLCLRVQGIHWHQPFDRMGHGVNDEEQRLMLIGRGYDVKDLWEDTIMDPDLLDDWMRRNIDVMQVGIVAQ